jgi:3-phenylpropionate/cinnamic acid dioxygenase small subunit
MATLANAVEAVGAAMSPEAKPSSVRVPVGTPEYSEIVEWLYREARLLDTGEFAAWFELMTADIVYEMPTRTAVMPTEGSGFHPEFGFFAESHSSLGLRVKRLGTRQAWAEQPRSRTRHFVSNVMIERAEDGAYTATSAFMVTRIRSHRHYDFFTGERVDVLRRDGASLRLARRTILLDQTVLDSHNLSVFF